MKSMVPFTAFTLRTAIELLMTLIFVASPVVFAGSHGHAESGTDYNGRIQLVSNLDEPDGMCLDIAGPPDNLILHLAVWIHTCHPTPILDQVFNFDSSGKISSAIPETDLCLTADSAEVGSEFHYKPCSQDPALNRFSYLANAQLQLMSSEGSDMPLCVAAAVTGPPPLTEPKEGQDPRGESMAVNPSASHLARFIQLQPCAEVKLEMSRWEAYEERLPEQLRRLK